MKRENSLDFLRVICSICIIAIHVSGYWVNRYTDAFMERGGVIRNTDIHVWLICLCYAATRFAIPCFMFFSGAFIIGNPKNAEAYNWYRKSMEKIGIPVFVFSVLYILYRIPLCFIGEEKGWNGLIRDILKGEPFYHMWYVYMLIGVYMAFPWIIKLKMYTGESLFLKIGIVFFFFSVFSLWTGKFYTNWNVGMAFCYCGIAVMGYLIYHNRKRKNNICGIVLAALGMMMEVMIAYRMKPLISQGIKDSDLVLSISGPSSPFTIFSALLIFSGVSMMSSRISLSGMAGNTFYIYLVHAGIWDVISKGAEVVCGKEWLYSMDTRIAVPIAIIAVFVMSNILAWIYQYFADKINSRFQWNRRIVDKILPEKKG